MIGHFAGAEIRCNPIGTKSRHQTAKNLLWPEQIAFSTAKSTRFAVETATSKSRPTMLLGLQQSVSALQQERSQAWFHGRQPRTSALSTLVSSSH
jgi:hypothetical protein